MEDVETPIGEADLEALPLPLQKVRLETIATRYDFLFSGKECMRQYSSPQLSRRNGGGALFADGDRCGSICHAQPRPPGRTGGKRHGACGGHPIACPRDVPHFDRMSRHMNRL